MDNSNKSISKRRDKGEGSIYLRSDGRWVAKFNDLTKYAKNELEAKKKLKQLRESAIKGEVFTKRITVGEYIKEWLELYKQPSVKPQSYDRYERTFKMQIESNKIANMKLGNITSRDLQLFINQLSQKYSYSTIKKVYEIINACFNHGTLLEEISKNPMKGVVMPSRNNVAVKERDIKPLSKKNVVKFIETSLILDKDGNLLYRYGYAFIFILNTGIRCGEALALKWENIDFDNRIVKIDSNVSSIKNRSAIEDEPKTCRVVSTVKTKNAIREIPLNNQAFEALKGIKERDKLLGLNCEYVICTKNSKIVTHANIQRALDRILKRMEAEHIGVHALRHTFATLMLEQEANIKVVSEILGHGSPTITYNVYVHTNNESKKNAIEKLDLLCC